MKKICIVGLGLIGGSLGMALRRVKKNGRRAYEVTGLGRSQSSLALAKRLGALDHFSLSAAEAVSDSDVVVLSVPVQSLVSVAKKIIPHMKSGAVLTDVGSVKGDAVKNIPRLLASRRGVSFVGAHPIAGSEKSGIENAEAALYRNSICVVTTDRTSLATRGAIAELWRDVGSKIVFLSAKQHDELLAITSHLPHLAAFSLFEVARSAARKSPVIKSLVAGSFSDMTRIVGSSPDVWRGIFSLNRRELEKSARLLIRTLQQLTHQKDPALYRSIASLSSAKKSW